MVAVGLGICAKAESLSTADGVTYNGVSLKRVDPDGLYIEYTPDNGGVGMSKIKFSRLTSDQRKQYGYDEAKVRAYEADYAKSMEAWQAQNAKMEQDTRARVAAQQAQSNQEQAMETSRILALAQLKQAEADLARATAGAGENYGGAVLGGEGIAFAIPQTGRAPPPITRFAPLVPVTQPAPFRGFDNDHLHQSVRMNEK